ncbi:MAG: hypothetical protein ABII96_09745 [Candidatus Zixiibacteriota bacterium]
MLTKITTLLIASVLLFASFSGQSCPVNQISDQKTDLPEKTCCCCQNSSHKLQNNNTAEQNCPCQVSERKPEDRSPAVVVLNYDSKPDAVFLTLEKVSVQEKQLTPIDFSSDNTFKLSSRDRPLYILQSSFLI